MKYEIKEEHLQMVFNYISKRPYDEVYQLISLLQANVKPIIEKKDDV